WGTGTLPGSWAGRGRSRGHRHHEDAGQGHAVARGGRGTGGGRWAGSRGGDRGGAGRVPEGVVPEMTALANLRNLRQPDQAFAATNELRTRGTDNLLAAAARAGTPRVIAQGYAGPGPDKPSGGRLKTEEDPLDW